MGTITEEKLLKLLNSYLKANSKARRLQIKFEAALKTHVGVEELSESMDVYIDLDIAGDPSATPSQLREIIAQSTRRWKRFS